MFINEEKLLEIKSDLDRASYFHNVPLSDIFIKELVKFNESTSYEFELDIMVAIKPFFHAFRDSKCYVKFSDNSLIIIEENKNEKLYDVSLLDGLYGRNFCDLKFNICNGIY